MKIFVTGGGGFLGFALIKRLLSLGHEVVSYSRKEYSNLTELGVLHVQGDIANLETLSQGMRGCEVCFHVASKVAMFGKEDDFIKTNVLGVQNIVHGCLSAGIKYLIHTSTPSVVFGKSDLRNVDESLAYPKTYYSHYAKTKAQGEKLVLASHGNKLKTISLRPHLIFGPGDTNLIPGVLEAFDKNKLKIIGDGQNLVDVLYIDNAVDAHVQAMEKLMNEPNQCGGQAYFIGQGPVKLWDFINSALKLSNRNPLTSRVPFLLCYFIGFLFEIYHRLIGSTREKLPMTRFVAMQLAMDHYFNHEKAFIDLGWKPAVSIEEGLIKTMNSLPKN